MFVYYNLLKFLLLKYLTSSIDIVNSLNVSENVTPVTDNNRHSQLRGCDFDYIRSQRIVLAAAPLIILLI